MALTTPGTKIRRHMRRKRFKAVPADTSANREKVRGEVVQLLTKSGSVRLLQIPEEGPQSNSKSGCVRSQSKIASTFSGQAIRNAGSSHRTPRGRVRVIELATSDKRSPCHLPRSESRARTPPEHRPYSGCQKHRINILSFSARSF